RTRRGPGPLRGGLRADAGGRSEPRPVGDGAPESRPRRDRAEGRPDLRRVLGHVETRDTVDGRSAGQQAVGDGVERPPVGGTDADAGDPDRFVHDGPPEARAAMTRNGSAAPAPAAGMTAAAIASPTGPVTASDSVDHPAQTSQAPGRSPPASQAAAARRTSASEAGVPPTPAPRPCSPNPCPTRPAAEAHGAGPT